MTASSPLVCLDASMRKAFQGAWISVVETCGLGALSGHECYQLLLDFATHYRRLVALPRRTRRSLQRQWKRHLAAIALLMALGPSPAWTAIIQVTPGTPPSIKADGKCSLMEAIVNANRDSRSHLDCVAGSGADTISLPLNSTQKLGVEEALPIVTSAIRIEGRDSTIMRKTPSYDLPLLRVGPTGNLTLNRTIISGASDTELPGSYGLGGIYNDRGTLRLTDSRIVDTGRDAPGLKNRGGNVTLLRSTVSGASRNNWFGYGGIVNGEGGSLALINSTVTGNVAGFRGGGISNQPDSTLTLTDSIVSSNRLYEGFGAGIDNGGNLTLVRSTVTANSGTFGGGIFNSGTGVATLIRSTISNNFASGYSEAYGGAIANSGTLAVHNSTVSGNFAMYGGGLFNRGTTVLANSTVTGNTGHVEGGGLFMAAGKATLRRSLITGNANHPYPHILTPGPEINNLNNNLGAGGGGGIVLAADFNLIGHDGDPGTVGFSPGATDITPNEPVGALLLPLADNGGGTKTHALAIGSRALDASPDDAACPATDQRGNPRPRGPACDIGAFEGVAVLCNGKVTTMVGTVNDDRLTGTAGPDVISGLLGNDTVYGLGGNDVVCAGSGNDVLYGGAGADLLLGEPGEDRLFGQGGNDTLHGGVGKDACDGGTGAGDTAATCETVNGVP